NLKLGDITAEIDDPKAAISLYEQARAVLQRLVGQFPAEPAYQADLAEANVALSRRLLATGRSAEAEAACQMAVDLRRTLGARTPDDPGCRSDLAATLTSLGNVYQTIGRVKDAEGAFREAIGIFRGLVQRLPDEAGPQE